MIYSLGNNRFKKIYYLLFRCVSFSCAYSEIEFVLLCTFEQLFVSVVAYMACKNSSLVTGLATIITSVRLFASVIAHVAFKMSPMFTKLGIAFHGTDLV